MSNEDENELIIREIFEAVDLDASGYIDETELAAVVDLHPEDLKEIFEQLDTDKDGKISIEEFMQNYKKFQQVASKADKKQNRRIHKLQSKLNASQISPYDSGYSLSEQTCRSSRPSKSEAKRKATKYIGQEYLDDLYEIARSRNDPVLLESLESFLTATVESLLQKQADNEKLDTALKRATEKNNEIAMELEQEMEQQVAILEEKIRIEEQQKLDQQKHEANIQIQNAQKELEEMEQKVKDLEDKVALKAEEASIPDTVISEMQRKEKENEQLQKKLLEFQTQMALMRSEVAQMKSEYDEQADRLVNERGTVLSCVQEQENLTRQLRLLHEANKKLHDTNDDLRSALDSRRSLSSTHIEDHSPVKRASSMALPKHPQPKLFSSFRSDPGTYSTMNTSFHNDLYDTDEDSQQSVLPHDDDVNEASLMTELMAADNQVYDSPIVGAAPKANRTFTPVDSPFFEHTLPTSERDQFVKHLEILSDTNKRLGESNDELRQALGLLSDQLRSEHLDRSSPTSCQSAPVTPMRSNYPELERPQSTSSPRKVLLTKSGYHSLSESRSMPDLSTDDIAESSVVNESVSKDEDLSSSHDETTTQAETTTHVESTYQDSSTNDRTCNCGNDILEKDMSCCEECLDKDTDYVVEDISVDEVTSLCSAPSVTIYSEIPDDTRSCICNKKQNCDICTQVDNNTSLDLPKCNIGIQCTLDEDLSESEITDLNKSINKTYNHICKQGPCTCEEQETENPLEKSTQISDLQLLQAEEEIEPLQVTDDYQSIDDMLEELSRMPMVDICPTCNQEIKIDETGMSFCACSNNKDGDFINQSINQVAESTILTDSDSSHNYSDQETSQPNLVKRVRPIGGESDQLSMYAQRQSDEEQDEDDMDDAELVRLVDQTNEDMSDSINEEPITIEEKVLEPRGLAVGADTSSESISRSGSHSGGPERMYKLVLAGNAAVGKSSFIIRLCKDKFYSALNATLGVDFQVKTLNVDGSTVALQLWDTAGQERFRSIAKTYFRKADGVVLLYDVTCENSFLDVRSWLESVENSSAKNIPVIICGNKTDLRPDCIARGMPVVSREQGRKLSKDVGALFIETSAKDGINVQRACVELTRQLQALEDEELQQGGIHLEESPVKPKKTGCCRS